MDCLGEITWQQNEKKSTIDYIITNADMHIRFVAMHIDKDREEFDLSDHNLLISEFNIKHHHGSNTQMTTVKRYHTSR